ncbi:MAG: alpha/beta hydrolase family protein [Planctomycetaceae bacterium]
MKACLVSALAVMCSLSGSSADAQAAEAEVTRPVVSEDACPLEVISAEARDGHKATAVVRRPPGKGPFPVVVFLHGGLHESNSRRLQDQSRNQPTQTRFLAAGYMTVCATFRSRREDPQTRDALVDCLAIIEFVKRRPEVDAKSVVVFGGSGGGSLALELAGETELCAVAAGEPASVLFTGMMTQGDNRPALQKMMDDPKAHYTPELRKFTREKIQKIACPVLIVHGDQHPINKINHEIVIPELKAAGKTLEVIAYPGQPHGFYYGRNGSPEAGKKCFEDSHAFFKRHLSTQPRPVDDSLVEHVPIARKRGDRKSTPIE